MNEYTKSTNAQPPAKRKRAHPARTARRAVGAAGIGSMLLMTGYMVVNNASATSVTTTATGTATGVKSTATAATPATVAQSTSKSSG
jgi:hypothetical protein